MNEEASDRKPQPRRHKQMPLLIPNNGFARICLIFRVKEFPSDDRNEEKQTNKKKARPPVLPTQDAVNKHKHAVYQKAEGLLNQMRPRM